MYIKKLLYKIIRKLGEFGLLKWVPDKIYLNWLFKIKFGRKINFDNPQTFNEKLQWLKIYDRKDIYTIMVDKYEAKKYVSNIIGEEYVIPTLGIYNAFDEIDFDILPNQFVIKCTHDSGGLIIVKDKSKMDFKNAKKIINTALKKNFYYVGREWPYKNVKPRIIVEKYLEDKNNISMRDYKFFCFDGEVKAMFIATERCSGDVKFDYFDSDFLYFLCFLR